ncbi:MAG: 50S ribosomal protein L24 [Patescibacteria group bacterium]|nr:50S ribosomal protein L24 [Patescibacteria group bacterium]
MNKFRLKTGDIVKVVAGKNKGKTGKILQTFPVLNRVVVEGVNISKRHLRTRRQGEKGQIIEFSMPIHASNVLPISESGKADRHKGTTKKSQTVKPKIDAEKKESKEKV